LLDEELQKKTESTLTSESRAEEMDKHLLEEETRITQLSKELEKIREKEVRNSMVIFPFIIFSLV